MSSAYSHEQPSSTFRIPGSSDVAPVFYRMLEGEWPVLQRANPVSAKIIDQIKLDANGSTITTHIAYLSLGHFFINTDLLEPHHTQRPLDQNHVLNLRNDFGDMGILRVDHPGVVIGLGDGWNDMKNNTPNHYMISPSSPHLNLLSTTAGGPIAQIIRGKHRTAAIKSLSKASSNPSQNYWFYQVLLPSMSFSYFF